VSAGRWTPWLSFSVAIALVPVLVLGALEYGLRVPTFGSVAPLPPSAPLDYASRPVAAVSPLSSRFVSDVLGLTIGGESAIAPVAAPTAGAPTSDGAVARPAVAAAPDERITEDHPLTNDRFAAARQVSGVPFTARTDTRAATREPQEPGDCAPVGSSTVWYRYQPAEDVGLVADTFGTDYATTLGVYRGSKGGALTNVGCDTDARGNAIVAFAAKQGVPYYFQVTGPTGGGHLVFNLDRQGTTEVASIGPDGKPLSKPAQLASISGDGRLVAFVGGDSPMTDDVEYEACGIDDCRHIFVRDRIRKRTVLASGAMDGGSGNGISYHPFLAGGGRYVSFTSTSSNLVPGDTNSVEDVFVHDLVTRETERASVTSSGAQMTVSQVDEALVMTPTLSWDGRYVAFVTMAALVPDDHNRDSDVYVHDRVTRTTERVSVSITGGDRDAENGGCLPFICQGPGVLMAPSISGNGRFVRFNSPSSNHVRGDTNKAYDTFVHDRVTGTNERVSVRSDGKEVPAYSNNEFSPRQGFSFDGRWVVFAANGILVPGDTNGVPDVYVRDRQTGRTIRASVSSSGDQGTHDSRGATISADGRFVAFHSESPNLVSGDTNESADVFVHDLVTRTTRRVSVTASGEATDGAAAHASLSADGSLVAFESRIVQTAPGPTITYPGRTRIYIHQRPRSVR
jgi:Tol biopolymer transport system component